MRIDIAKNARIVSINGAIMRNKKKPTTSQRGHELNKEPFTLTRDNYFSDQANSMYMSNSRYKSWKQCAAKQWATENNIFQTDSEEAHFIGGRYAHTAVLLPEELEQFEAENPEVRVTEQKSASDWQGIAEKLGVEFSTKKPSRDKMRQEIIEAGFADSIPPDAVKYSSKYAWIESCLDCLERQFVMQQCLEKGESEVVLTFELGGIPWRCMIDNLRIEDEQFDDLKFMRDFNDKWSKQKRKYVPWFEVYDYECQMAVYRYGIIENYEMPSATPNIFGFSKQSPSMPSWIQFTDNDHLDGRITGIEADIQIIKKWIGSDDEPPRCNESDCDYCRGAMILQSPIRPSYGYTPQQY